MIAFLDEVDPDEDSQELILEQFAAEARSARLAFHQVSLESESDAPFIPKLSAEELSHVSRPRAHLPLAPVVAQPVSVIVSPPFTIRSPSKNSLANPMELMPTSLQLGTVT